MIAVIAMTHALGSTHWNAAACRKVMGVPVTPFASGGSAVAIGAVALLTVDAKDDCSAF